MRKRFEAGLLFGVAYSLSKSIDDQSLDPVGSSSGGGLTTTNSRTPADTRDWRQERGLSDFDRRHVFTAQSVYELPFGKGKPIGRNVNRVLNLTYVQVPHTDSSGHYTIEDAALKQITYGTTSKRAGTVDFLHRIPGSLAVD